MGQVTITVCDSCGKTREQEGRQLIEYDGKELCRACLEPHLLPFTLSFSGGLSAFGRLVDWLTASLPGARYTTPGEDGPPVPG